MRFVLVGLVLAGGLASADPLPESSYDYKKPNTSGVFLDVGGGWQRFATDGVTYRTEYVRFAPQVSLNQFLYVGAALGVGNIYGAYGTPDNAATLPPVLQGINRGIGTVMEPQLVLGARGLFGLVSAGGEIAPMIRWFSSGPNSDSGMGAVTYSTTIAIHGRADFWATPHFTAGVMVGMDVSSIRDFQAGLSVGFHFEPYDTMKR